MDRGSVLSLAGAFVAALCYGAATVVQAIGVRRVAASTATTWWGKARDGRLYAVGLALDAAGFLASAAALHDLPLFLVEAAVASSVGVTALLAVIVLHDRLSRREVVVLCVLGAGLVLLALGARSGPAGRVPDHLGWWLLGAAALPVACLVAGLAARRRTRSAVLLAVASGLGFGGVGVAARVLVVADPWWHSAADVVVWALLVHGVLAMAAFAVALDRGAVTTVAAVTFVVETVVPAGVGLAVLGDGVRSGWAVPTVVGFVATVAGSVLLARHAEVEAAGTASP